MANCQFIPDVTEREWARLLSHIQQQHDGCWLWTGCLDQRDGYGRVTFRQQRMMAYRLTYQVMVGSIPIGYEIDHLCRQPACVNPSHLEAVTSRENTLRGTAFTADNSRKTHCQNGHALSPANLKPSRHGWRDCRECVRERARRLRADRRARGLCIYCAAPAALSMCEPCRIRDKNLPSRLFRYTGRPLPLAPPRPEAE